MFLTHLTTENERWDQLAWRYYGDTTKMTLLIEANPHVALRECIPSGQTLYVPVIEPDETQLLEVLPPWKR